MATTQTREYLPQFSYRKKDFKLDWFSGTGAGGQHRNKHQNCLRLTHIPSGITVTAQDNRDRITNQRNAFERLRPKLLEWIRAQIGETKFPRSSELVRTYHEADNRVSDHASGVTISWSELDKRIDDLIEARMLAQSEEIERRQSGMS